MQFLQAQINFSTPCFQYHCERAETATIGCERDRYLITRESQQCIIEAFQALGLTGSTSMRSVGPGIANALFATALGLFAAIPAAVSYNYFGHVIKEIGARMEDFSLEFMNVTERTWE